MTDEMIDQAIGLIDWIPDTTLDSVVAMILIYGAVMMGVMEIQFWLDRRENRP